MKYIFIAIGVFISTIGYGQMIPFVQPEQVPSWFPFTFNGVDSIGLIEQDGQDGGTYELLLVYPDTTFQIVNVTYNPATGQADANKRSIQSADYLRGRLEDRVQAIREQNIRDSIFFAKYTGVYQYLGQFVDTTIVEQPVDTGQ